MCGIAGILNFNQHLRHAEAIRKMTGRLAHRGPDAEGIYIDDYVALGHRRLSIIDVSEAANQPMWDHSGRYAIIYNGELYNYQDLKKEFPNYPFRTASDSEVVLASYQAIGPACLKKMNGMFAFAIYDKVEHNLFVARDRLGKKPFFYSVTPDCFVFSSEVRSIVASGIVAAQLEESILSEFLMYQAAMGPHTMLKNIKCLSAGSYAIIQNSTYSEHTYWGYEETERNDTDIETARKQVHDLFTDSVRLRMISSDVPVGAFLSGGIDSSLVVACMAGLSEQPVNTFNISFDEKQYDESGYAEKVATMYNTRHHRILIRPEVFLESVEEILSSMDTPSGDGPNTYLVAKYTRKEGIKVALSGLGGDELFVGYNKFIIYKNLMRWKWILNLPHQLRYRIGEVALSLGPGHKSNKLAYLFGLPRWDLASVYPLLRRSYSEKETREILNVPIHEDRVAKRLEAIGKKICWMEDFSKATIGEIETYTRDVLLRDTDQMAMAHALEVRAPFFDYRLIEYVLSLPDEMKFPHTPKQLLTSAFPQKLPPEIIHRKKMGFTFPMEQWLKHELSGMVDQKMNVLASRSEFNGRAIMQKWNRFKQGDKRILWSRIWKLVVLADWLERMKI